MAKGTSGEAEGNGAGKADSKAAKVARKHAEKAARMLAREDQKRRQAVAKQAQRAGQELQRLERRLVEAQSILAQVSDRVTVLEGRLATFRASLDGHRAGDAVQGDDASARGAEAVAEPPGLEAAAEGDAASHAAAPEGAAAPGSD